MSVVRRGKYGVFQSILAVVLLALGGSALGQTESKSDQRIKLVVSETPLAR